MLISAETVSTLIHAGLGVALVLGTLIFLVGVCNANAWFVRIVEAPRSRAPVADPRTTSPSPSTTPSVASSASDHLLLVLAAAASHMLEEEIRSLEILDVQPYSPWKLEGRMAIHRGRLTGKGISAPAFPLGGTSR